jgi:hypothetical protein
MSSIKLKKISDFYDSFFEDDDKYDDSKKIWLQELIDNQLTNVRQSKRLYFIDLQNIINNVESSLFNENKCCIWNGKMSSMFYPYNNAYMKIIYKNRKHSLQRLLYENYVGEILHNTYIKYTCNNNKIKNCCNIKHMICIEGNKFKKDKLVRNFKEQKKNKIVKRDKLDKLGKIVLSFD